MKSKGSVLAWAFQLFGIGGVVCAFLEPDRGIAVSLAGFGVVCSVGAAILHAIARLSDDIQQGAPVDREKLKRMDAQNNRFRQ